MSFVEQAIAKLRDATRVESGGQAKARPMAAPSRTPRLNEQVLAIDMAALRTSGYFPEEGSELHFGEYYRRIKRPILEKALSSATTGGSDAGVIMITSALPGEGKTFASINMALSMARERDISVLLVDADILKPRVSEILGVRQEPGLMDALLDDRLAIESLVQRTNVPGLSILPAGRGTGATEELLISNRMRQILAELRSENGNRIVLLDSPPLLVTSEARTLTKVVGQVVLIARAGKTPKPLLKEALDIIGPGCVGGIILNDAHFPSTEAYYGYGLYGDKPEATADAGKFP